MSLDAAHSQSRMVTASGRYSPQVSGNRWMVVAGHPLAAQAGARMLEAGGNAVDAGVAAGICLGVVHPDMVSVAGVAPIIVHLARPRKTWTVSGIGGWPRAARVEFFQKRCGGQIPPGILRTVVPAAPRAWCAALARWGTMSFAEVAASAIECAERGFPLSEFSAMQIQANQERYQRWPTTAALYLPGGRPLRAGDRLVQSELARTLRTMAGAEAKARGRGREAGIEAACDAFYKGEVAAAICAYHRREGGLLTPEDLADFQVEVSAPSTSTFRDIEVATCGFWCQGPALLQILNLLEPYDLARFGHNSPPYLHLIAEAIKLAFADREAYYGDPAQVKVPADGLLSKAYAEARRTLIGERAWADMPPAGDAYGLGAVRNGAARAVPSVEAAPNVMDTSYVAVVDAEGNAFSATPSDPSVDSPVVPGVGCVVSPRGSQSWLDPDHPSAVAPGRRPRLTPSPAIAFKDGRLLLPFGTPGGDVQLQAMLQVLLNVVIFGMRPQQAVEAPRVASRSFPDSFWPHPSFPGRLLVEGRITPDVTNPLADLGHAVQTWPEWEWRAGAVCAILVGPDGTLTAGADPRRASHAIGW
ncbi:MAG: gamma-glutamyltransferase family protein [Candidatus Rokubacteria bacterium]|nr:gamma-glutamyltransferase family protein [Candidatus Rokubacteria bacterium]